VAQIPDYADNIQRYWYQAYTKLMPTAYLFFHCHIIWYSTVEAGL